MMKAPIFSSNLQADAHVRAFLRFHLADAHVIQWLLQELYEER